MSVARIASRYAKSLIELAQEQKKMDRVLEDINSFSTALETRDLYLLVKSPIVNVSKKKDIFNALFSKSFDELTLAFFGIILRKGREAYLPEIAKEYVLQYKIAKGISSVKITTASPMSDKDLERIRTKLLESGITAQSIEFTMEVDPEIIGGFVIQIEDNLYDASVARKLNEIRKDFSSNKFVKAF